MTLQPWQRAAQYSGLLGADGRLGSTIFSEMSQLANETGAINLGQGFPDEDGPHSMLEDAKAAIDAGINQYPPGPGILDLRTAIAEHQARFYDLAVNPDTEVLVTAGASEALAATLLAFVDDGDEVITFEPFYDLYAAIIGLAGGTQVTVPVVGPDFQPDLDALEAAFSDKTRAILINNPNNPTGAMYSRTVLETIVELATRYDALIIADEVYEHLVFDRSHTPIATLPGAAERTVTISSAAKTFSVTGWKIGWLHATADTVAAIRTVKQYLTFVNGAPFQPAIANALRLPDSYYRGIASALRAKRDILIAGLQDAGFEVSRPSGSYFVIADAAPLGYDDGTALCRELPGLTGVVGVPVSAFVTRAHEGRYRSLIRFAFCKRERVLRDAAAGLARLTTR